MLPFELYLMLSNYASQPIFNYDYDANGRLIYAGVAQIGSLLSQPKWLIVKAYIGSNGRTNYFRLSDPNQVWNNRATTVDYHASDI